MNVKGRLIGLFAVEGASVIEAYGTVFCSPTTKPCGVKNLSTIPRSDNLNLNSPLLYFGKHHFLNLLREKS